MSVKTILKIWKAPANEKNACCSMTSSGQLRHRKAVTFDLESKEKLLLKQQNTDKMSEASCPQNDNAITMTSERSTRSSGHVNGVFCCQDEADYSMHSCVQLSARYRQHIGGHGSERGQLQDATDVQWTPQGKLLTTDLINSRLQLFDSQGHVTALYQSEDVLEPWASAMTPDGRHLAVTSRKNKKVVLLDTEERQLHCSIGEGYLSCPSGLAVTSKGEFIVTDIHTNKVNIFARNGEFLKQLGSGIVTFCQPRYVTVSHDGDVIVSDSGNHRLVVFDKHWNWVRNIGKFGKGEGCLKFPHGVCTDPLGNILVCDRYNDRVTAFTRHGDFVCHLVTSEQKLRHPQGVTLSPGLELFVSHGGLKAHSVMVLNVTARDGNCNIYP